MRGKVSKPLDVIGTPGITPAYAGKSDPYYELIELK